jgi:hypothetical protein
MNHLAALEAEVRDVVSGAASSAPPELTFELFRQFADTGDRYGYEHPYFKRRGRLVAAGGAALFDTLCFPEGDGGHGTVSEGVLSALADELWRVCDEYTWALPAHEYNVREGEGMRRCVDLFAAETAHMLSEILEICGKQLDARVAERVRDEVLDRVLIPFADDPRPIAWEASENNWLAVCAGAVGMSALIMLRDDPERLQRVLDRSGRSMDRFLGSFGDDGGCAEGVDYWIYGFGYFVYFAEALRESGGSDLLDDPKVRALAAFPARVGYGNGYYPSFSDGSETAMVPPGLVSRLAERVGAPVPSLAAVPSHASDFCHRWAHLARNITWTDPAVLGRAAEPSVHLLPDLGWVVDRGPVFAFAAKGGHNDEPHNHLDLGHFILHAGGETLLADLGGGEYTKGYFREERYLDIHPAAEGHSIPVLDGRTQPPGREHAASVIQFSADDRRTELLLDLTRGYEVPGLEQLIRRFKWVRETGTLILVDHVATERGFAVDELFISHLRPRVEADRAVWEGESAVATMTWPGRAATPEVETIETTGHRGDPETVHRLRVPGFAEPGTTSLEFVITLSTKEK